MPTQCIQRLVLLIGTVAVMGLYCYNTFVVNFGGNKIAIRTKVQVKDHNNKSLHHQQQQAGDDDTANTDDRSTTFNYDQFWNTALEIAISNNKTFARTPKQQHLKKCPKIYIYKLPPKLQDKDWNWTAAGVYDRDYVFGKSIGLNGHMTDTNQYSWARQLEYRLRNSKTQECYTDDPTKADLYYVPVHPKPKISSVWSSRCNKTDPQFILEQLHYLNESTACRHFFILSKAAHCGHHCRGWWVDPVPQLRNVMRVAYSNYTYALKERNDPKHNIHHQITGYTRTDIETDQKMYPNLFSVPHPTSVHWGYDAPSEPPWTKFDRDHRNIRMLYIGRIDHGDVLVRHKIAKQCERYDNTTQCLFVKNPGDGKIFLKKSNAVFCLEPGGDNPWRKSIGDSISFGCIPVFFSNLTDDWADWAWSNWKKQGRSTLR